MSVYLDASVLVSMFVADPNTPRAWRLAEAHPSAAFSLWTVAEFSSALSVRTRMKLLESEERLRAEARLDQWLASGRDPIAPSPEDFLASRRMLRETAVSLRAPDALHLAICSRIGADLASFDRKMLQAAVEFTIPAVDA